MEAWQTEALALYQITSIKKTWRQIKSAYPTVRERTFQEFLKQSGAIRDRAAIRKLQSNSVRSTRSFSCECHKCDSAFNGKLPTALFCKTCLPHEFGTLEYQQFHSQWSGQRKRLVTFNVTEEQLQSLLNSQNSKCGVCLENMKVPCLDHNHTTGKIRGYLCHRCNLLLGQIEKLGVDSVDRMIDWIETRGQ